MAAPYATQPAPDSMAYFAQTMARMRGDIESVRLSISGSRSVLRDAHAAIARANTALARQMSEKETAPAPA